MEYFWESEYKFAKFLKSIFPTYQRKYSLEGNGIFNLITLEGNLFEIKYNECKVRPKADNHSIDKLKKEIIDTIISNLKTKDVIISGGKYITFPIDKWIAKIEIVKKLKMPA